MGYLVTGGMILAGIVVSAGIMWVMTPEVEDARAKLLPNHPANWKEYDVSLWLNTTVQYPEYSQVFAMHAVDGPTLFYLTEKELEYLEIENPVHRAKILAHLDLLRGRCMCTPPNTIDFWEYARKFPYQVLVIGAMMEWSPRLGFAYLSLFDSERLWGALDYFGFSTYPTVVFTVAAVAFAASPHFSLILFALTVLFPTNWLVAFAYVLSHFGKGLRDWNELLGLMSGLSVKREFKFQIWYNFLFAVSTTRAAWILEMRNPFIIAILGLILPWWLEQVVFYIYIAIYIVSNALYLVERVLHHFGGEHSNSS